MSRSIYATAIVAAALLVSAPVFASDGAIELNQAAVTSFPITLSTPGRYTLTSNLTVSTPSAAAILIMGNDITIDLNGFVVSHSGGSGGSTADGIDSVFPNGNAIEIRNGAIRGFGGNCVQTGNDSVVRDLRLSDCGSSGALVGRHSLVANVVAADNGQHGILTQLSSVVRESVVTGNTQDGIQGSGTLEGNLSESNGRYGIQVTGTSTVRGNTIKFNGTSGLRGFFITCSLTSPQEVVGYSANTIAQNGSGPSDDVEGTCLYELGGNVCGNGTTCP